MTQNERQIIIKQIVGEIVELTNPVKVLIFGSATGRSASKASDLDFLVVIPDRFNPDQVLDRLNLGVKTRVLPCDFIVANEKTVKKYGQTVGLIYREALTNGEILYAA